MSRSNFGNSFKCFNYETPDLRDLMGNDTRHKTYGLCYECNNKIEVNVTKDKCSSCGSYLFFTNNVMTINKYSVRNKIAVNID